MYAYMTNAVFLSHNGLGDNLYSVGALRFLLQFYDKIFFLCKQKYYENVILFFASEPRIICVPFDETNERNEVIRIVMNNYNGNDVFICGNHVKYLQSKVTNPLVLQYKCDDKGYDLNYDTINDNSYSFIRGFYTDIKLDLGIFYEYFHMDSTTQSIELYESVKHFKRIIFLQTASSDNKRLNIENLKAMYMNDDDTILISNNENLYDKDKNREKHELCKPFVMNKIAYYIDLIQNCSEIYIIDSCFTGIVLPLVKTNRLKATKVRIILRQLIDTIII
jgi:hypothetical protein